MSFLRFKRLAMHFSIYLLTLTTLMLLLATFVSFRTESMAARDRQHMTNQQMMSVVELATANALWQYNDADIIANGDSLLNSSDVVMVQIIDNRNIERYFRTKSGPETDPRLLHRFEQFLYKNEVPVGEIIVVFTDYYSQQQVYDSIYSKLWQSAIIFVVLGFSVWQISRPVVTNIQKLTDSAKIMAAGNLDHPIVATSRDEIGELALSFNQMAISLRTRIAEIHEREERFRTLVDNLPGIVYRCKADDACTMDFISDTVAHITGYPAADFINNQIRTFSSIVLPEDIETMKQTMHNALEHRLAYEMEYRILHRNGTVHWLSERGQGVFDDHQQLLWLDGAIFDITSRKESQVKLQQYTQQLETIHTIDHLILSETSLVHIGNEIIHHLQNLIACRQIAIFTFDFEAGQAHLLSHIGEIPLPWQESSRQPLETYPLLSALGKGLPLFIHDSQPSRMSLFPEGEFAYHMEIPLIAGDVLMGSLHFAQPATSFTVTDQEAATMIAATLAMALQKDELDHQRQSALESLQTSERKFRGVFEGSHDAIIVLDHNRIIECNEQALHLYGVSRDELLNKTPLDFSPTYQSDGQLSADLAIRYQKETLSGKSQFFTWTHLRPDGSRFIAEVSFSRLDIAPNILLQAALRDVTARVEAEEALKHLNEELEARVAERTAQLEATNRELEAFSYSVSHDLRAPLRAIDGFSMALLEDFGENLDDMAKDYLSRVRSASQRMGHLIDDMLSLSRITRSEIRRSEVSLSLIAEQVFQEMFRRDPDRVIDCIIQPNLIVQGDERLLHIVLENLIGNAWKFTGKTLQPRIEFSSTGTEHDKTIFCLKDNGAGFDMTYASKMFGAFQRLHSEKEFPGTGVGLATVLRIIHRHGGRIWAEGEIGKGASFYFTL